MVGLASGKVILLGEHAVVYGVPALVLGIDRGATAQAALMNGNGGTSELVLGELCVSAGGASDVARAFAALLASCEVHDTVRVEVSTELPAAAGLGCSAALAVAIVRALDAVLGRSVASNQDTIARAMAWEQIFHGNPSGIDATAAARGGCLWYQKGPNGASIQEVRLAGAVTLAIGHSGTASSTRAMVEHIARLRDRNATLVAQSFDAVSSLAHSARLALETHDLAALGQAMDENQQILSGLMLSTREIDSLCQLAHGAGALGAKLTGSGGGGCVVALVSAERDAERVLDSWAAAGYRAFSTRVLPALAPPRERFESA
jgi:mevalonate kinase